MRKDLKKKKVLIIRNEKKLIKLLFSFFPDIYIHDIQIYYNTSPKELKAIILFLTFEERGIAIGKNGNYIKAVNKIFQNNIILQNNKISIKIKCDLLYLYEDRKILL